LITIISLYTCTLSIAQTPALAPPHAILLNGTALVPVRALATGIEATVTVTSPVPTVTLERDATTLTLTAYATAATSNGQPLTLLAPPLVRGQQLYVPVRAVATVFGATIGFRGSTPQDSAKGIVMVYQGTSTLFRTVEDGRMVNADFTGSGQVETAFAVANVFGIDAYNSPYLTGLIIVYYYSYLRLNRFVRAPCSYISF
jgi:hypothetical protein